MLTLPNNFIMRLCVLLVLLAYAVSLPLLAHGQDCSVFLRVKDVADDTPLSYATVMYRLRGGNMEVGFTDESGIFRCNFTSDSIVQFRITYFGYEPYEISIKCGDGERKIEMRRATFRTLAASYQKSEKRVNLQMRAEQDRYLSDL